MIVKIILHNLNDDTFVIANGKSNRLIIEDNKLYVHTKYGAFVDGRDFIEEFDTKDECMQVYNNILKFLNRRKNIRETINLTLKDIKNTKDIKQREVLEEFLWTMESKFLKYDELYLKDIL